MKIVHIDKISILIKVVLMKLIIKTLALFVPGYIDDNSCDEMKIVEIAVHN